MNIEIRGAGLEARLQKQLQATGSGGVGAKIRRGMAQVDRGEGIPEDRVDAYWKELKARSVA
jgi:hypothetical protein